MSRTLMEKAVDHPVLTAVVVVALVAAIVVGAFLVRLALLPVRSAAGVVERVLDSDNVLYNYEWFKQRCQDVRATEVKLNEAQAALSRFQESAGPRERWDFRDKEEKQRLETNLTGLRNIRSEMVADYNARARMVSRNIFMGRDVPDHIDQ